jgi:hypothetical protein
MLDLDECHAHISRLCKRYQPARTPPRTIHTDDDDEFEGDGRAAVSETLVSPSEGYANSRLCSQWTVPGCSESSSSSWCSCPQSNSGRPRLKRHGGERCSSCEARPSEVGGGRSSNTTVPYLPLFTLRKCDLAKLGNRLRGLQCLFSCLDSGSTTSEVPVREMLIGPCSKTDIVTPPWSWSTRVRSRPPRPAPTTAMKNGELGHRSHIIDRLKEQANFSMQRRIFEGSSDKCR